MSDSRRRLGWTPRAILAMRANPAVASRAHKLAGTMATRIASVMLGGVATIVTARVLHPNGLGTYEILTTIATIAITLGHLSLEQSNAYLWQRGEDRFALATNSLCIALAAGAVVATGAWIIGAIGLIGSAASTSPRSLAVVLAAVPLGIASTQLSGLALLHDRISRVNLARLLPLALATGLLLVLAARGALNVQVAVALWAFSVASPAIFLLPGLGISPRRAGWRLATQAMKIGAQYHLGMAALFLLWRVDVLLLAAMGSRSEVGVYTIAVTTAELLYLVTDSIASVVLPRQMSGDIRGAVDYTVRVFRINAAVTLGFGCVIGLIAPVVLPLALGNAYQASIGPLLALLPGVVAFGLSRPITAVLVRFHSPLRVSRLCGMALLINVGLNAVLIPPLGTVGAATASSVAYIVLAALYLSWFIRESGTAVHALVPIPVR